jgi:hypothetical protein
MNNLSIIDKLNAIKKLARYVTYDEELQRGLEILEATGLPLEDVASLARSVGLDLEDVAHTIGSGRSVPHRPSPVQIEADLARQISEIHEVVVERQAHRLASLSQTERDLYNAADEQEAFKAEVLCARTDIHYLNSNTKQCLSNLVKSGLLKKAGGRKGYLRTPTKS